MDDGIYDALIDLKKSVDKQTQLQEDGIDTMKALISSLRETAQAVADLQEALEKNK
jgi:signal transduction histidine kinase